MRDCLQMSARMIEKGDPGISRWGRLFGGGSLNREFTDGKELNGPRKGEMENEAMESYRKGLGTDIFYSWDITTSLYSLPVMCQTTNSCLL